MSQRADWLPASRKGILVMSADWMTVCTPKKTDWGIPEAALTELSTLRADADVALTIVKTEASRTPVATARCREAFDALTAFMRDFKRRYLLSPPLLDSDLIALGLKPRDTVPTPSGVPAAQVTVETYLIGRHELGIKILYVTGTPDDPANKGYRIWYKVVAPGETPPANPETDLAKSFFTKRKKDVMGFDFGDSGKTAWFAVQVENDGKKGKWGPLVSALIP
jgi:hypothetical protein